MMKRISRIFLAIVTFPLVMMAVSGVAQACDPNQATYVAPGVRIPAHAQISQGVYISTGAHIGDYARLKNCAFVGEYVTIGYRAYLGVDSVILDYATVGGHAVVGGKTVVDSNYFFPTRIGAYAKVSYNTFISSGGNNADPDLQRSETIGRRATIGSNVFLEGDNYVGGYAQVCDSADLPNAVNVASRGSFGCN